MFTHLHENSRSNHLSKGTSCHTAFFFTHGEEEIPGLRDRFPDLCPIFHELFHPLIIPNFSNLSPVLGTVENQNPEKSVPARRIFLLLFAEKISKFQVDCLQESPLKRNRNRVILRGKWTDLDTLVSRCAGANEPLSAELILDSGTLPLLEVGELLRELEDPLGRGGEGGGGGGVRRGGK